MTRPAAAVGLVFATLCGSAVADVYTLADGTTVEGETYVTGPGGVWVMRPSGRLKYLAGPPERTVAEPSAPWTTGDMVDDLEATLGPAAQISVRAPFVIAFVPEGRLVGMQARRARGVVNTAAKFFKNCERVFETFCRRARVPLTKSEYPLAVLIFESDVAFNEYSDASRSDSLAASRVAGFYSPVENHLVLRLSECDDFQTPLHEAIHVFTFNLGLANRLAPLPTWWVEGIASSFANNETDISVGPQALNRNYVRTALAERAIDWDDMIRGRIAFYNNDSIHRAYAQGWMLHWYLVNAYPKPYLEYVKALGERVPGVRSRPDEVATFTRFFKKSPGEIQAEARQALAVADRRSPEQKLPAGLSRTRDSLGVVELKAVGGRGGMRAGGRLQNASTIRPLAFVVRVETTDGLYAQWYYPEVDPRVWVSLAPQVPSLPMRGATPGRGVPAGSFFVRIESAVPGSEQAEAWAAGRFRVPEFRP